MLKKVLLVLIVFISILFYLTIINLGKIEKNTFQPLKANITNTEIIGKLTIPKINLEEYLYDKNSKTNNIEEHVTILKESIFPDNENSIIFLAAHSGSGKIAFFEELDKLEINDLIFLNLYQKKYQYQVKDIWEEKKNGYIHVNKSYENQLVLTTCHPKKKKLQLIINCIEKES